MELNVIDTNRLFLQKEGVNQNEIACKIGTHSDQKLQNGGTSQQNLPTMPKYESTPTSDHD